MRVKDEIKYKSIDPEYYDKLAMVESSGNPNAQAESSSAAGLYQFVKSTWNGLTEQMGLDYTEQDRFDPDKSRKVVEEFTKRNSSYLKNVTGEEPTSSELYLAHLMGMGTAGKFLRAAEQNPYATVDTILPESYIKSNPSVFTKNGKPKTVQEVYNWSAEKFGSELLQPYKEDESIYGIDSQGNFVTVNPNTATESQKIQSDVYKEQFYLTNYKVSPKNTTFASTEQEDINVDTTAPTPTKQADKKGEVKEKTGKKDVWKQKLQQKINERSFMIGLVNQGATDFIGPQRQQSTAVQQIQQSYMQDGGQIPTSPNGLYDYPDAEQVLVPVTNGRITMKNITTPVLGISQETGQQILMQPNKEYFFPETKTILEIPQR